MAMHNFVLMLVAPPYCMMLRTPYALSGTDLGDYCDATHSLCAVRLCCYQDKRKVCTIFQLQVLPRLSAAPHRRVTAPESA
eukprot:2498553-Rhodomonas_salina.2